MEASEEQCPNCRKSIPAAAIDTHVVYCSKHIKLCPECKAPVQIAELTAHIEQSHTKKKCRYCKASLENSRLQNHEKVECGQRPINCSYCSNRIAYEEYSKHQQSCASRTVDCEHCRATISVRNQVFHDVVCSAKDDPDIERMAIGAEEEKPASATVNRHPLPTLNEDEVGIMIAIMESLKDRKK